MDWFDFTDDLPGGTVVETAQGSTGPPPTSTSGAFVEITDEFISHVLPPNIYGPPAPNEIKLTYLDTGVTNWFVQRIGWDKNYTPTSKDDDSHSTPDAALDYGNGDNPGKTKTVQEPTDTPMMYEDTVEYYCYLNSGAPVAGGKRAEKRTNLRSIFIPAAHH